MTLTYTVKPERIIAELLLEIYDNNDYDLVDLITLFLENTSKECEQQVDTCEDEERYDTYNNEESNDLDNEYYRKMYEKLRQHKFSP
jgi:hypothetical protein